MTSGYRYREPKEEEADEDNVLMTGGQSEGAFIRLLSMFNEHLSSLNGDNEAEMTSQIENTSLHSMWVDGPLEMTSAPCSIFNSSCTNYTDDLLVDEPTILPTWQVSTNKFSFFYSQSFKTNLFINLCLFNYVSILRWIKH